MSLHPFTILIGSPQACKEHLQDLLQKMYCPHSGCKNCQGCARIEAGKDHRVFTLTPSKSGYLLEDIALIHNIVQFVASDPHVFIMPHAELLSESSGNSLLKVIEEPPANYFFYFLTQHPEQLLPTIRSRAILVYLDRAKESHLAHPLVRHFLGEHVPPAEFLKIVERQCPSERETVELIDALFAKLVQTHGIAFVDYAIQTYKALPMPGGAKIFWKNLYLMFDQLKNNVHG